MCRETHEEIDQVCQIWTQSESDLHQMGQIQDFSDEISENFGYSYQMKYVLQN